MKAAVFTQYGGPEVLQVQEIERPQAGEGQVLLRVRATAVNSGDVRLRKADPFAVRFMLGLTRPKLRVLGGVFAGEVVALGKGVTRYKVGDAVFGSTDMKFGAYAEYLCVPEAGAMALKPANLSHTEAAVVPFGGATALFFLRKAKLKPGQKVLIYGASGAVGVAAVQLAKHFGAEVTAVCSTANVALLRSLGADHVIDYTRDDLMAGAGSYDVVYDTVNKLRVRDGLRLLRPRGVLLLGAAMMGEMLGGSLLGMLRGRKVAFGVCTPTAEGIGFLQGLMASGAVRPVIDRAFPLEQIAAAHAYVDQGRKKGNVAVVVG